MHVQRSKVGAQTAWHGAFYFKYAGSSDPYVEVLLMPEDRLNVKAVKTESIKSTLNPYYQKEFNMYVSCK